MLFFIPKMVITEYLYGEKDVFLRYYTLLCGMNINPNKKYA